MNASTAILGGFCIAGGLASAIFVAWRLSSRVMAEADTLTTQFVVALVLGLAQLIGVELLCGAVDALYAPVVLGVHLAIAGVVYRTMPARARPRPTLQALGYSSIALGSVMAFSLAMAIQLSAGALLRTLTMSNTIFPMLPVGHRFTICGTCPSPTPVTSRTPTRATASY